MAEFAEIGLSKWLINKLDCIGVKKASGIQKQIIPILLKKSAENDGRDIFACSRTGSGKTLAYILPIVERLVKDPRPYFALILAPTRELAYQIHSVINVLTGKSASQTGNTVIVKSVLVVGGGNYGMDDEDGQDQGLWFGKPNIIVGTPGRILDLFTNRNYLDICGQEKRLKFEMLVLDEADQLITHGFCQQMKEILDWIDEKEISVFRKRQTLVFSATLTPALEHLQKVITGKDPSRKPVVINLLPTTDKLKFELATNPELDQKYILCPEYVKTAYLAECLLDLQFKQLIIFCATKKEAKLIHKVLLTLGFDGADFNFSPVLLNADLKQSLRFAAIDKFKSLKSRILVTTDLASRGLDIPQVDLVINYNCPKSSTLYIHRVGRTCRKPDICDESSAPKEDRTLDSGGKSAPREVLITGKAVTFVTQYDINLLKSIETQIGIKLEKETKIDEEHVTTILKQVALAVKDAEIRTEKECIELDEKQIKYDKRKSKNDKNQKKEKHVKT